MRPKSGTSSQGKRKSKKKRLAIIQKASTVLRELNRQRKEFKFAFNQELHEISSKSNDEKENVTSHNREAFSGHDTSVQSNDFSGHDTSARSNDVSMENMNLLQEPPPSVNLDTIDDRMDKLEDYVIEMDNATPETPCRVEGRRIIDYQYFFDQLLKISQHSDRFGCQLSHLKTIEERRHGFSSKFKLRCSMCGTCFDLEACDKGNGIDVNDSAVSGMIMIGCGWSNLNELASSMNLPTMNNVLYSKCHEKLHGWYKLTAERTMKKAAAEERTLATEKTSTGTPMISVTADASWCKRSYRTNYSSLAGVGAIIGINSGKVLHISVKNKYCRICMRAKNKKQVPREHKCNANHKGSSSSMEQVAIVEGFKKSVNEYNLVYSKLIADGDASTYKNILESRPYPNVTVEKIECSNHLQRNYNGKNMNLLKDTSIPISERHLLNSERQKRLRMAITSAVRYRENQNLPLSDKIKNLRNDIINSPMHIFGEHSNCEDYYCTADRKLEPNYVPLAETLMKKLKANASIGRHKSED